MLALVLSDNAVFVQIVSAALMELAASCIGKTVLRSTQLQLPFISYFN